MAKNTYFDPDRPFSNWSPELSARMVELQKEYGSTQFWNEFLANPYLNFAYEPKYPKSEYWLNLQTEYRLNADKYISELLSRINEQNYNTALAQSQRERAAGINSDLAGNVTPGTATEATELPTPALPSRVDYLSQTASLVSTILGGFQSILGFGMNFAQQLTSLKGSRLENQLKSVSYEDSLDKLVIDRIVNSMEVPEFKPDDDPSAAFSSFETAFLAAAKKEDWANGIPSNIVRDYRRQFNKYETSSNNRFSLGVQSLIYDKWNKLLTDKKSIAHLAGSPDYSDDLAQFIKNFSTMYADTEKAVWDAVQNANRVRSELQSMIDSTNAGVYNSMSSDEYNAYVENRKQGLLSGAELESAQNRAGLATAENTELREKLDKTINDGVKQIDSQFDRLESELRDDSSMFSKLALALLPLIRAKVLSTFRDMLSSPMQSPMSRVKEDAAGAIKLMGIL